MNLKRIGARTALAISLTLAAGLAVAQTTPRNAPPPRPDQPRQTAPQTVPSQPQGSPGESLSQSQGVIQPPAVPDRGGVLAPPNTEKTPMPVIPPPGTPGGNQNVQPK